MPKYGFHYHGNELELFPAKYIKYSLLFCKISISSSNSSLATDFIVPYVGSRHYLYIHDYDLIIHPFKATGDDELYLFIFLYYFQF